MNKKKYILLTLMLSLININNVYASCSQETLEEFAKVEDQYTITYEFNRDTKDYTITIGYYDLNKFNVEFDAKIDIRNIRFLENNTIIIKNISPNEYTFNIINSCFAVLKEENIVIPKYNIYFDDPACEGIEDFYLCQPSYEKEIDYDTFLSRINTYKKKLQKEEQDINDENKKNESSVSNFISDNLSTILIVMVFVILVIITGIVTFKSIKKSRGFE